jgi:hypothetical protein
MYTLEILFLWSQPMNRLLVVHTFRKVKSGIPVAILPEFHNPIHHGLLHLVQCTNSIGFRATIMVIVDDGNCRPWLVFRHTRFIPFQFRWDPSIACAHSELGNSITPQKREPGANRNASCEVQSWQNALSSRCTCLTRFNSYFASESGIA